jgi:hypothetical protein
MPTCQEVIDTITNIQRQHAGSVPYLFLSKSLQDLGYLRQQAEYAIDKCLKDGHLVQAENSQTFLSVM